MAAPALAGVDWHEVKTLSLAIGAREAARKMGLNEESVKARCRREGWLTFKHEAAKVLHPDTRKAALKVIAPNAPIAPTAAEVLAELGPDSKRLGAIVLNRSLRRFSEMDPDDVIERADKFKAVVSTGTPLHGWGADKPAPGPLVSFTFNALPIVEVSPVVEMPVQPITE